MRKKFALLLSIAALASITLSSAAQETPTPDPVPPQADGVSIAVYNRGTALVQDRRTFTLEEGESIVNFTDVAATIARPR